MQVDLYQYIDYVCDVSTHLINSKNCYTTS
jgi:hypothetical protein